MKVTRTIVYEGTPEWMKQELDMSFLSPGVKYNAGHGTIEIIKEEKEEDNASRTTGKNTSSI